VERDYEQFPDDDNGEVLWRFRSQGDTLTVPREIDFTVILPSEEAALQFAATYLRGGFKVELTQADEPQEDGLDWEITIYTTAVPTHSAITTLEAELGKRAASLGGRASGWSAVFVRSA
jgi:hypothetical protein